MTVWNKVAEPNRPSVPLLNRHVLLVEDNFHIAEQMRRIVTSLGGLVVGPVSTVVAALALITQKIPDLALLDIDLDDHTVYPVADALRACQTPFVFATGYEPWMIDTRFADIPTVEKPMTVRGLTIALARLGMASSS
jgi:CheY-like chemotaxis protein